MTQENDMTAEIEALIGAGFSLGVRAAEKLYVNHGLDFDASLADQMLSLTLDSKAEAAAALATLLVERDAAVAEAERLRTNRDRFPELMAQVIAEKNLPIPDRIERLKSAIGNLAPNIAKYQWVADEKPAFGERYIRHVAGDNGEGMGRQWLASCPPHIKGLAEYIAAANPDTVSMLLADIAAAVAWAEKAEGALRDIDNEYDPSEGCSNAEAMVYIARAALPDAAEKGRSDGRG